MRRRDYATAWGFFILLLIVTSPVWLVIVLGLLVPFLIVAFIVAIPVGIVAYALKK